MISDFLSNIGISSIFDVLKMIIDVTVVSFIIYWVIISLKNTRAYQLLKGVFVLIILAFISQMFNLRAINYLLTNVMTYGIFLLIVVFQPELRKALESLGKKRFSYSIITSEQDGECEKISKRSIGEVCRAVESLSRTYIGALIVIERDYKLGDIIKTGINLDSRITGELLVNIFTPNTPLHDGAVILSNDKISAAGCILPLSENRDLSKELGTRHRAGLGITESSDAIVIIVSEETGKISLAIDSGLTTNIDINTLKKVLNELFISNTEQKRNSKINNIWKNKKN